MPRAEGHLGHRIFAVLRMAGHVLIPISAHKKAGWCVWWVEVEGRVVEWPGVPLSVLSGGECRAPVLLS